MQVARNNRSEANSFHRGRPTCFVSILDGWCTDPPGYPVNPAKTSGVSGDDDILERLSGGIKPGDFSARIRQKLDSEGAPLVEDNDQPSGTILSDLNLTCQPRREIPWLK